VRAMITGGEDASSCTPAEWEQRSA
jgi:hypothetical protein